MITTETMERAVKKKRAINYIDTDEADGQPTTLLGKIAKLLNVNEVDVARELNVAPTKKKKPSRPQAKCPECGKRYAVQDASCAEEQDTCPACRDEEAAPFRERVLARDRANIEADKAAQEKQLEKKKDAEDERMARLAALVAKQVVEAKK